MSDVKSPITYKKVPTRSRLKFLPTLVANNMRVMLVYECSVFDKMTASTAGTETPYQGGKWDFLEFENGAKAMVLSGDYDKVLQANQQLNYYSGSMSQFALSIAINMMICSQLSFATRGMTQTNLAENYHKLRAVASELPDAVEIFGFLD